MFNDFIYLAKGFRMRPKMINLKRTSGHDLQHQKNVNKLVTAPVSFNNVLTLLWLVFWTLDNAVLNNFHFYNKENRYGHWKTSGPNFNPSRARYSGINLFQIKYMY